MSLSKGKMATSDVVFFRRVERRSSMCWVSMRRMSSGRSVRKSAPDPFDMHGKILTQDGPDSVAGLLYSYKHIPLCIPLYIPVRYIKVRKVC